MISLQFLRQLLRICYKNHLVLVYQREFKFFDKAIKGTYGKGIGETAQVDPAFAFQAMRIGLTALYTRRRHRQLVQQIQPSTVGVEPITTSVTDRRQDGETAFSGSVAHAMDGLVNTLETNYKNSEADFVISIVRNPGLIDRLRNRGPQTEVVAIIPHGVDL